MPYQVTYTDKNGDIEDVYYLCGRGCLARAIASGHLFPPLAPDTMSIGSIPIVPESDNDIYCHCGALLRKGVDK